MGFRKGTTCLCISLLIGKKKEREKKKKGRREEETLTLIPLFCPQMDSTSVNMSFEVHLDIAMDLDNSPLPS